MFTRLRTQFQSFTLKRVCLTERNFQKSRFLAKMSATVTQEVIKIPDIEVNVAM